MNADVVVVGAGPAGGSAALRLARVGARVLLLERSHFPREKPCGDGLTPRALAALDDLGIEIERSPEIRRVVARSSSDFAQRAELSLASAGTSLQRAKLDHGIKWQVLAFTFIGFKLAVLPKHVK